MADEKKPAKPGKAQKAGPAKRDYPAKAGKRKLPHSRTSDSVTTPESRARGRKLADLFALRQPQHPREEIVTLDNGTRETRELPPQPRATRAEFMAPAPVGWGYTEQLIHKDVKAIPLREAEERARMANWRLRPIPANERVS